MNIIIALSLTPHADGEIQNIGETLSTKLREYGHKTDIIMLPNVAYKGDIPKQLLACRLYDMENICERLICIGSFAYLLKNSVKHIWFSQSEEIAEETQSNESMAQKEVNKEYILRAKSAGLKECLSLNPTSYTAHNYLKTTHNLKGEVLYTPLDNKNLYTCEHYGDYLYNNSPISISGMQLEIAKAMLISKTDAKVIFTGKIHSEVYAQKLQEFITNNNLAGKITVVSKNITIEEKAQYLAKCLGIVRTQGADAFLRQAQEGAFCAKPIITLEQANTETELLTEKNAFCINNKEDLADSIDMLYENKNKAIRMGEAGREILDRLNITWDKVVGRFTK